MPRALVSNAYVLVADTSTAANGPQVEAASTVTGNASRDVVPIRREIRISTPGRWNCPTRS
jgi:hypothetical protein